MDYASNLAKSIKKTTAFWQAIPLRLGNPKDWAAAERPWPGLKTDQPGRAMMIILSRGKSDA